ncbi:MAG: hypothetical protein ACOYW7_11325, partial [Nitrospirota bacterium]
APIVIGHPKDNAPAYGWVEALKREGETLYMKMKDVVPQFADMLKEKLFKKRSISLYADGTLRHVGWLGAMPPAVKGLADAAFSEGEGLQYEFAEENQSQEKGGNMLDKIKEMLNGMMAQIKEMMSQMQPADEGGSEMSETKIQARVAEAMKAKEAEFAEAEKKKAAEFSEREAAIKKKESELKAQDAERKKAAILSFCEDLKKKGVLTPAMEKLGMGISEFMQQIASIETPIEFGEEGKKEKQTPLEFMQAFLSRLPKAVEFGEVAAGDKDAGSGNAAEKRERLVSEYCEKNKDASYKEAVLAVSKEHPDLFKEE